MTVQHPGCTCPRVEITVSLPEDMVRKMQACVAENPHTSLDEQVESAFSRVGGRIDPCIAIK
jgi:Arc/MetJ-type ribon-helix-helix transcriptional regulator